MRARTIEEFDVVMEDFFGDDAYEQGLAFKPKETDIFITPASKCGTTLIQQIAHGLRTRGSMDFEEITAKYGFKNYEELRAAVKAL